MRFKYEGASVNLIQVAGNTVAMSSLLSLSRGKGHARRVVELALNFADANGYTVVLHVQRFHYADIFALTNPQLVEFYEKFGFRKEGISSPIFMRRPPASRDLQAP